jgi:CO/xanthine dehydrogenase Mo-binding subunit
VIVDYEPLPAVVDVEAAMEVGAALARTVEEVDEEGADLESIHAGVDHGQEDDPQEELSGNVLDRITRERGDAAAAFAASDAIVEGTFRTPWVHQAYLEPQVCTAWLEPSGVLVVSTSTQGVFVTRNEIARAFDLPLERVRVIAEPLGGAFGGKFALVEPLATGAALALKRPVRLVFTRSEDFAATNPASAQVTHLRIGGRADGTLTGIEARMIVDRGSNAGWGVEGISSLLVAGPYNWEAFDIRGYGVQTNRVTFGAYRAPGAPTAAFALESLLDELAAALDIDPIELRHRNAVVEGDIGISGNPYPVIGGKEVLERIREHPLWANRASLPEDEGVGMAAGHWPGGLEPAAAVCRVNSDGTMTVVTSAADMSGVNSGFAVIAAAAFGLSPDAITVVSADSTSGPYAGGSGGSKVTYTVGAAVLRAAEAARVKVLAAASQELEIAPDDLEVVDGVVRAVGAPDRSITVEEIAKKALRFGGRYEPVEGHGGSAQTSGAPSVAAHLSHVRVDRETGEVTLLRHVVAQDVGRALNPALVEGQMRGGATQGMGWALLEELAHDEDGRLVTGSFLDYAIPTAERVPEIETLIVEVPAPDGPFGAKGIGEAPVVGAPAAVANAVAAATGTRMYELPMTAPRVWKALRS